MQDLQREIINQVASGQISAAEGASRLEALRGELSPAAAPVQAPIPPPPSSSFAGARAVRVISQLGSATIVGDPTVSTATAEGPHSARQDGDTMTIELGLLSRDDTFSFGPGSRLVHGLKNRDGLIVRMNPDLALSARVRAGDVRVMGVHGPITLEVQAGDCKVEDFRNVLNAVVQAGSVSASGRLDRGASKVKCQMGEVKLNLEKGSSVRIAARSTLGDVSIDGADIRPGGSDREVLIGSGAGTLELECTMGDIKVNAG
jgi:hypothetical protein